MMSRWHGRRSAAWVTLVVLAACRPDAQTPNAPGSTDALAVSATPTVALVVDSQAVQTLRRSMDYLNGLQRFSAKTRIFTEDLLDTGHRVDFEAMGGMTVERPNKLVAERHGAGYHQAAYFDGSTLTLYDSVRKVYASKPAPGDFPAMFQLAYDSLGLSVPSSDLIWPNVFPLMMKDVVMAAVMDQEIIDGVLCDHLLFSRTDVDFQIWIPVSGEPWPRKYIVTDTSTPALLSIVTTISDWKANPRVSAGLFTFVPPTGVQAVPFLNPETNQ
jgi:hypothetical protein